MRSLATLLLLPAALAAPVYKPVPGVGMMHEACVFDMPSGTEVHVGETSTILTFPNGSVLERGLCADLAAPHPMIQVSESAEEVGKGLRGADDDFLPPDYDGWLQYTQWKYEPNTNAFTGFFSVPDVPAQPAQVLYFFTGLQNIPWIPKVDPLPTQDFTIIQPVLQTPGSSTGWAVRSWYVTLKAGAYASTPIDLNPGDKVWGNMTRTGPDAWTIISSDGQGGHPTVANAKDSRVQTLPYAYTTVECYGCDGCATYPTQPIDFTQMVILNENSDPVTPTWEANPDPAKKLECHEATHINSPSDISYSFQ